MRISRAAIGTTVRVGKQSCKIETATFNEMLKNPLKNTGTILKSFAGLDSKTRNMLLKTIFAFVKSAKNNFSDITGGQNKITVS